MATMSLHPERYEKKSGGGCLMLFGLPFLLVGLAVMIGGLGGRLKDDSGQGMPILFAICFGGIFASVGAGFMFGRSGVTLDKRTNQAVKWWGLLVPMKRTVVALDSLEQVEIAKEIRRSDKSTYTVYPVRLTHGAEPLKICEPRDYQQSRREAEEIAKFLGVALKDASSGGEGVVRQADELDHSIRDQVRAKGEVVEVPATPTGSRVRHELADGKLTFEIPAPGVSPVMLVVIVGMCLLPLGSGAFFFTGFLGGGSEPWLFKAFIGVFVLFFVAPVILIPGRMILKGKSRERITVTPQKLELSLVSPWMTRTSSLPAGEIEELELVQGARMPTGGRDAEKVPQIVKGIALMAGGGATIMARTDKETLQFGRMLSRAEAEWMHALIKRVLTS